MNNIKDEMPIKILIGAISLIALMLIMGIPDFYSWTIDSLLSYVFSAFFVIPIAFGIIQMQFPKEYIVLILFGTISLCLYAFVFSMGPYDIVIDVIQTVIFITIFSSFFSGVKEYIEKRVPP